MKIKTLVKVIINFCLMVILVFLITSCQRSDSETSVRSFLKAAETDDCEKAMLYVDSSIKTEANTFCNRIESVDITQVDELLMPGGSFVMLKGRFEYINPIEIKDSISIGVKETTNGWLILTLPGME